MTKFKTKTVKPDKATARNRFLRGMRKQRVRTITVLPSLVSILNGVCGFAAIVFAGKAAAIISAEQNTSLVQTETPYFTLSAYMVLLAMIADMLDGRLARMSHSTSSFGGQLDSLCDTISFGVAPAFLMLKLLEFRLSEFAQINPGLGRYMLRFIWLAAAAYISCTVIRLARFNVENEQDESAHMSFIGLPSPAAAGVVVSLVIFHQQTLPELLTRGTTSYVIFKDTILYTLPFFALGASILMVSRIRYPHVLNQYLKGKKPFAYLIWTLLLLALVLWSKLAALVIIFCGFALGSFLKWLYFRVIHRRNVLPRRDTEFLDGLTGRSVLPGSGDTDTP